jgi:hypothetical protein
MPALSFRALGALLSQEAYSPAMSPIFNKLHSLLLLVCQVVYQIKELPHREQTFAEFRGEI